ncbi:MAG TPA: orotidine-5'-phosphate decarboxylase [Bacteroidia bacterium]|nr:orotidine-5'-phosphate decarboxylase [Bacteroidia bacterium]HNU32377.1 orotidine-5'-phosphate decarboxylase [Bacteroidia bacterium]
MTYTQLVEQIKKKQSYLCIGLDTDIQKIPAHLLNCDDPVFEFNKQIIDATHEYCVAYKPNTAFYESLGTTGWLSLEKTIQYLNKIFPSHFTIADAKRGDIGNTSQLYARAFFETLKFDSITVAPYMGEDSVKPFLEFKNKWAIILGVTSNAGAKDFQFTKSWDENESEHFFPLFHKTLRRCSQWGTKENIMFVAGATKAEMFKEIREIIPDHFLLVPGVGAQGGSLKDVSTYGMNDNCGLLVNSSRQIIYAGNGKDFALHAKAEAEKVQKEMSVYLKEI